MTGEMETDNIGARLNDGGSLDWDGYQIIVAWKITDKSNCMFINHSIIMF